MSAEENVSSMIFKEDLLSVVHITSTPSCCRDTKLSQRVWIRHW